jgi:hypothetical protein
LRRSKESGKIVPADPAAEAPATIAPTKANGTVTLAQIRNVAATINALGGYQRMTKVLDVIREAGGVKKLRDLAEAMQSAEAVVG